MAKDPAFLFYPGDWLTGTMGLNFEEKGAYFELLIFQFSTGKFTKAQAKQVLSICSASVFDKVLQKLDTDGTYFWKQRLSDEIEKRKKFSESRRNNAKSNKKQELPPTAYAKHMENRDINENESVNEDWERWGDLIVNDKDQYWEQMKGRKVGRDEMNGFLSVATRNKWKIGTAQEFRISLRGFDLKTQKQNGKGNNTNSAEVITGERKFRGSF